MKIQSNEVRLLMSGRLGQVGSLLIAFHPEVRDPDLEDDEIAAQIGEDARGGPPDLFVQLAEFLEFDPFPFDVLESTTCMYFETAEESRRWLQKMAGIVSAAYEDVHILRSRTRWLHIGHSDLSLRLLVTGTRMNAASSFSDESTAIRVLSEVIDFYSYEISDWSCSRSNGCLPLRYRGEPGVPIGRVYAKGGRGAVSADNAIVILKRTREENWSVVTAFPQLSNLYAGAEFDEPMLRGFREVGGFLTEFNYDIRAPESTDEQIAEQMGRAERRSPSGLLQQIDNFLTLIPMPMDIVEDYTNIHFVAGDSSDWLGKMVDICRTAI